MLELKCNMPKKKIHKICKPIWFVQSWEIFPNDTMVCVNMKRQEIIDLLHKNEKKSGWVKGVAAKFEKMVPDDFQHNRGMFWHPMEGAQSILMLFDWDGSWENHETLMHELHHATLIMLGQKRGMIEELEAMAYAQVFLFREIRQKIAKRYGR
jgi:hypothetical protein